MSAQGFARDVARQALVNLAAALLAAWLIGQNPGLRRWLKDQAAGPQG